MHHYILISFLSKVLYKRVITRICVLFQEPARYFGTRMRGNSRLQFGTSVGARYFETYTGICVIRFEFNILFKKV